MPLHPPQLGPRPPAAGTDLSSGEPGTLAGLILWLPPRERLPPHREIPEGCYNHPVVVLSPKAARGDDVVVVLVRHTISVLSWNR